MTLRAFLVTLAFVLALCGCAVEVAPPVEPPAPAPGPVEPPGPTPSIGAVPLAAFDAIEVGQAEASVRGGLGAPFREFDAAGYRVLQYVFTDSAGEGHLFVKDGAVARKARIP